MRLKCKNEHVNQQDAAMLMDALSLSPMAAQLLLQRGIDTVDAARSFLYDETLCDPFAFTQMADAVKVIKDAISQQKHIVVYGDYDCDGISACAILVHRLTVMGADVSPYIPSRSFEGYGLNLSAMEVIAKDAGLVITVDCGIGSMSEIAYLREKGIDVVLTDHHTPGDVLPNANALLNPKVQAPRGLENLCGCGMAYTLARALGAGDDDYIAICAMATIGDIVPLLGENRIIVKRGLRAMNENRPVFLKALMEEARLGYDTLGATQVAYMLVPRINAAGRMDDAMVAYHLLQTEDAAKAAEYARTLCAYNVKRQSMEEEILKEALAALKKHPPRDRRAVYAFGRGWHQGVVGIVASRLTEQFQMPAVVGSIDESGSLTASLRSVGNVNIHTALTACEDLFSRYGGHAQAGGFTMESDQIETFIERFEDALYANYTREDFVHFEEYDAELSIADINMDLAKDLALLEPFGCGNNVPVFLLRDALCHSVRPFGKTAVHLSITIKEGEDTANAILFKAENKPPISEGGRYTLLGTLEVNHYKGRGTAGLILKKAEGLDLSLKETVLNGCYGCVDAFTDGMTPAPLLEGEELTEEDIAYLLEENPFGTLIVANSPLAALAFADGLKNELMAEELMPEVRLFTLGQSRHSRNTLLVCPGKDTDGFSRYRRIVYLDGICHLPDLDEEQELYDCAMMEPTYRFVKELLLSRERLAAIYRYFGGYKATFTDANALCRSASAATGESAFACAFALKLFLDLKFFALQKGERAMSLRAIPQKAKISITDAPLYRRVESYLRR